MRWWAQAGELLFWAAQEADVMRSLSLAIFNISVAPPVAHPPIGGSSGTPRAGGHGRPVITSTLLARTCSPPALGWLPAPGSAVARPRGRLWADQCFPGRCCPPPGASWKGRSRAHRPGCRSARSPRSSKFQGTLDEAVPPHS